MCGCGHLRCAGAGLKQIFGSQRRLWGPHGSGVHVPASGLCGSEAGSWESVAVGSWVDVGVRSGAWDGRVARISLVGV